MALTSIHHAKQDAQSLALARAIVKVIDAEVDHQSLAKAKTILAQWLKNNPSSGLLEWAKILEENWTVIKEKLLEENEAGQQRRQNSPFCGILSPRERWSVIKGYEKT